MEFTTVRGNAAAQSADAGKRRRDQPPDGERCRGGAPPRRERADDPGCTSLAVPVLGTGAAGVDFAEGAEPGSEAITDYEATTLADVRMIAYSATDHETLRRIADTVSGYRSFCKPSYTWSRDCVRSGVQTVTNATTVPQARRPGSPTRGPGAADPPGRVRRVRSRATRTRPSPAPGGSVPTGRP